MSKWDWESDLESWVLKNKVSCFMGNIHRFISELSLLESDWIFSIQYRNLIRKEILEIFSYRCVNLHFSFLPKYGGCFPVAWVLLNSENFTGVTMHIMTEQFDDGDIVAQKIISIDQGHTARNVYDNLTRAGFETFCQNFDPLIRGKLSFTAQSSVDRLCYSKNSIDFQKDSLVDWDRPTHLVIRQFQAFSFQSLTYPIGLLLCSTGHVSQVRLDGISIDNASFLQAPGTINESDDSFIIVATGGPFPVVIRRIEGEPSSLYLQKLGFDPKDVCFIGPRSPQAELTKFSV